MKRKTGFSHTLSSGKTRSLKKGAIALLAGITVMGVLPGIGTDVVHANIETGTPTSGMILAPVAGTGNSGNDHGDTAVTTELNTPTELNVIGIGQSDILFAIDSGNQDVFQTYIGPNLGEEYRFIKFQDEETNTILVNDVFANLNFSSPFYSSTSPQSQVFIEDQSSSNEQGVAGFQTFVGSKELSNPQGIAAGQNSEFYVVDAGHQRIAKVTLDSNSEVVLNVETYVDLSSYNNAPKDIAYFNGTLYVTMIGSNDILVIDSQKKITNLPGQFSTPSSVATDSQGMVYVANTGGNEIVKVNPNAGPEEAAYTVIAGTGSQGYGSLGQDPLQTDLDAPQGIAVGSDGTVYFSDTNNHRILKIKERYRYDQVEIDGEFWNVIRTAEDLDYVRENLSGSYVLGADIDLAAYLSDQGYEQGWKPIGNDDEPFTGRFEGQNHTISGLSINLPVDNTDNTGLFGRLDEASVQNLSLTGVTIKSGGYVGGLSGETDDAYVKNVYVQGSVSGYKVTGLLVGDSDDTIYINNRVQGNVNALVRDDDGLESRNIGGLIGRSEEDSILHNEVDANVIGTTETDEIGGLSGTVEGGIIRENAVRGTVQGNYAIGGFIGDFTLYDNTFVSDNYTWSDLILQQNGTNSSYSAAAQQFGGFIGNLSDDSESGISEGSIIQNNYASNNLNISPMVSGQLEDGGPFLGRNELTSENAVLFSKNFWNLEKFMLESGSTIATGLTDTEMKNRLTFTDAGWDFNKIWLMSTTTENPYPVFLPYNEDNSEEAPSAPQSVTAQAGNASATIKWDGVNGATSYTVYQVQAQKEPQDPELWIKLAENVTDKQYQATGLENNKPYVFAVKAVGAGGVSPFSLPSNVVVPTATTTPTTPSNPSTGGGTSTPVVNTPAPTNTPAPSNTTIINVNVQNNTATNGSVVASLAITRTKGTDGTTKDALQLTPAKATEIINLLKTSGSKTAAIVLPDTSDEVSQWDLTVPGAASKLLTDEGIELVILNPNVRISVPASSLTGLTDDLYFRLIPVKSTATSSEIQSRALANQEIVTAANGGDITVVGRPMTIETNLQSRPVTLTLPLPEGSSFTAAQQKKLGVYIEHSDGTKQLVAGKVVMQEDGKQGLEITVNHFSTFTIVNVSNWGSTLIASPYIMGYANGSFKPVQNITRAELAAIVGRITGMTEGTATFSDVKNGSWASTVVGPAAASGIMTGYGDGTFKPNASITRGELAAALAKLLPQSGLDASVQAGGFSDLAASHWAAAPAAELQAAGVVTGYADGSFKAEQNVTRAEAVTMINRLIGLDGSTALPGAASWNDVADTYWAYDAVRAASMQR